MIVIKILYNKSRRFGEVSEFIFEKLDIPDRIKLKYPLIRRTPWMHLPPLYGDAFESIVSEKLWEVGMFANRD